VSVQALVDVSARLRDRVGQLTFSDPAAFVYNPLDYAWEPHRDYLERWGEGPKDVVFVGMNPGPWGMAQNGVPFGATTPVRDFLGVRSQVHRPDPEHPKRPIEGLGLGREEVSGTRLWGWVEETWTTPEAFFERFFVYNFCPLCFMADTGRNVTPDKLKAEEREPLLKLCADALRLVEPQRPALHTGPVLAERWQVANPSAEPSFIAKQLVPHSARQNIRFWHEPDVERCAGIVPEAIAHPELACE